MLSQFLFLVCCFAFVLAEFDGANQFAVTPLSNLKGVVGVPVSPFDLNQLSQQSTPQDIRNYLAGQILKQTSPVAAATSPAAVINHPPPSLLLPPAVQYQPPPPPPPQLPALQSLMLLKSLKTLQSRNAAPHSPSLPQLQTDLVSQLGRLLSDLSSSAMKTSQAKKERPPQICIQFIDLSPKVVESILNKNEPMPRKPNLFVNNRENGVETLKNDAHEMKTHEGALASSNSRPYHDANRAVPSLSDAGGNYRTFSRDVTIPERASSAMPPPYPQNEPELQQKSSPIVPLPPPESDKDVPLPPPQST